MTPTFPASVAVGQTNVAASVTVAAAGDASPYQIANGRYIGICSSGAYAESGCSSIGAPWSSGVTVTPACAQTGAPTVAAPACSLADLGVLKVGATATGAAGTACAGVVFDVADIDGTRYMLKFEPRPFGSFIALGASPNNACRINFSFDVLKAPKDADAGAAGAQTRVLSSAGGWYFVDAHKKSGPLKAVGSTTMTVTTPCVPGNPACPTPTPTPTPTQTPTPTPTLPACVPGDPACPTATPTPPVCVPGNPACPTATPTNTPTATPTCTPNPGTNNCNPLVVRMSADPGGPVDCTDSQYRVFVTVDGPARLVKSVSFTTGNKTRTLTAPSRGEAPGTYVIKGAAKSLKPGRVVFKPRVVLQGAGSFKAPQIVQTANLKPVSFVVARDCRPTKVRFSADCTGTGSTSLFGVVVTGVRDPKKISRVQFIQDGRAAKTLRKATSGNRWAFNGSVNRLGLRGSKFKAKVTLRKGSFKRNSVVSRATLGPVTVKQSRDCLDPPDPPPGG